MNTPLLDYTIEFLLAAGVQEIILFCCSFAEKIKAHVAKSKWSRYIVPMTSEKCMSMGDAMREIDRIGVVRTNFILV
jgi:translation initiation factor eIF-2B subunit epsilon